MGPHQKWVFCGSWVAASKIIFQATKEYFEVLGRQDGKCMQPCENTIVYFGFPFFEEAKLGKYNHVLLIQDLSPPFQGTAQTM